MTIPPHVLAMMSQNALRSGAMYQGFQGGTQSASLPEMFGQTLGSGLEIYGYGKDLGLWGGDDTVSRRTSRRRGRQILENYIQPTQRHILGKAEDEFRAAPGEISAGYGKARTALTGSARGDMLGARDAADRTQGEVSQSLTSGGLQGGSIFQAAKIGIGAHTARVLADIRSRLAGQVAGLHAAEGAGRAGARQATGQFLMGREAAEYRPNLLRYNLWTQQEA